MRNALISFLIACAIFAAVWFTWTKFVAKTTDGGKAVAAEEAKDTGYVGLVLAVGLGILIPAGIITILIVAGVPIHWYAVTSMARRDFIFTNVPEAYFKEVVRFGGHRKTILSKAGHKIDANGDIVPLAAGEAPETSYPGGLRLIGWPFIDRIYTRDMKFQKSLPDGTTKSYDVAGVGQFYAKVDYPYALNFEKCEDKNNLPLHGHATLLANITGPARSLFATANFYDTMIGLVLPEVRECLKGFTYDEIKNKDDLDEILWAALQAPNPKNPDGVIGALFKQYGICIVALRIVNIDPPEEYRDMTLAKWKAEREADAARSVAKKQAEETEGRVVEAVARANGLTREELEDRLKANPKLKGLSAEQGGYKEDFVHARDVLKRDRAGEGLEDIRVGNVDGTPLEPVVGILSAMFGLKQRQNSRRNSNRPSNSGKNRKKGDKRKKPEDMDDEEIDDEVGW